MTPEGFLSASLCRFSSVLARHRVQSLIGVVSVEALITIVNSQLFVKMFAIFPLFFAVFAFVSASALERRAIAFFAPNANGGTELDDAGGGLGEPLNVSLQDISSTEEHSGVNAFLPAMTERSSSQV